jgi:hypothetical protein
MKSHMAATLTLSLLLGCAAQAADLGQSAGRVCAPNSLKLMRKTQPARRTSTGPGPWE